MTTQLLGSSLLKIQTELPNTTIKNTLLSKICAIIKRDPFQFADPTINLNHLKTQYLSIDLEKIPQSIQIDELFMMFQEINFDSPCLPGYMPPSTRKEEGYTYSKAQLVYGLNTFIQRVEEKKSFFKTPEAGSIKLINFFIHVEGITRFAIYKVNKAFLDFIASRGGTAPSMLERDYPIYEDLLQAKARLVLDLSFTGYHCGGRYVSTCTEIYQRLQKITPIEATSLEEKIHFFLGELREKIANEQVAKIIESLKKQVELENTAHALSAYMANLGALLGIPGAGYAEESSTLIRLNQKQLIRDFFKIYTAHLIKEYLQEKIESSLDFREMVLDWIKEQSSDWKKEEFQLLANRKFQEIQGLNIAQTSPITNSINLWVKLLKHLKESKIPLPDPTNDSITFILEVLSLEKAKTFFKEKNLTLQNRMSLQAELSTPLVEPLCKKIAQAISLDNEPTFEELPLLNRVSAINQQLAKDELPPLFEETLIRALEGKTSLEEVLQNHLDRVRKNTFLAYVDPFSEESQTPGKHPRLKPEILNLILSFFKILN